MEDNLIAACFPNLFNIFLSFTKRYEKKYKNNAQRQIAEIVEKGVRFD